MEFALSKELRTLGVVEFVVFLISATSQVKCSCINLSCYNIDFIDLMISALEMGTYIALLVLFRRDVRMCDDSLITTVIVLAAITLALKLLNKTFDSLLAKVFKRKEEDVDQEALQANTLGHATDNGFKMLERMERHENWFTVLAKCRMLIFPLTFILMLAAAAWAIFSFATMIKLAIPEDFQTSCVDNSIVTRAIMLGIPIGAIALYVALMSVKLGISWYMSRVNLAEVNLFSLIMKQTLASSIIIVPVALTLGVLSFILFIRLLKVWRGEELELYEYVGLSVCTPLIPFSSGSSEEERDS